MIDYTKICFVIMPFGRKAVGARTVDFDRIYADIFVPAIAATPLPAGEVGRLEPRRTDQDFFAGNISNEMFLYLEYSRFALADISGLNANVFYELGAPTARASRARRSSGSSTRPFPSTSTRSRRFPTSTSPR
jgi:hypothetical protein